MKSDKNNITIRYAQPSDREELYHLWQACFHDSDRFTDYYFDYYFRENRVLMLEDSARLQAMLHLNPYRLMTAGKPVDTFYIVGVATDEQYRHRGAMTRLLQTVFEDIRHDNVPFVYLMPADEAIYRPFQFAYIYDQQVERFDWTSESVGIDGTMSEIKIKKHKKLVRAAGMDEEDWIVCRPVTTIEERQALADRVNEYLSHHYDVYSTRDAHYYERLQMENQADGGDLMMLYSQEQWTGALSYARENAVEVREIICRPEQRRQVIQWMKQHFRNIKGEILPLMPEGFLTEQNQADAAVKSYMRPVIMGRIIHLEQWMRLFETCPTDFSLRTEIRDAWIEENNGTWLWQSRNGQQVIFERTDQQPDLCLDIDTLMQWMTGYCPIGELEAAGKAVIKTDCRDVLQKIPVLQKILINEIV
ncbi:MAG: enhanced intracellular survival protein Eis [Coprococcus sp.]